MASNSAVQKIPIWIQNIHHLLIESHILRNAPQNPKIHVVGVNPHDALTPDNFFNVTFPHEHDPLSHYAVSGNAPPLNPVERL